jgi:1,4-alpha-glucan branching enzyme
VPRAGRYREILNTDSTHYGGSDAGNAGYIETLEAPAHGMAVSLSLTLPPLGVLVLEPA